jgi:LmbE family N-acetylglucosaminyl deacetylase
LLGYKDQEVELEKTEVISERLRDHMELIQPDVVITFGPQGISRHSDHIAIHRAALSAFNSYEQDTDKKVSLLYVAIPELVAKEFDLDIDGPETQPNVFVSTHEYIDVKVKALRTYRSQEDAQEFAEWLENSSEYYESFKIVDVDEDAVITFENLLED